MYTDKLKPKDNFFKEYPAWQATDQFGNVSEFVCKDSMNSKMCISIEVGHMTSSNFCNGLLQSSTVFYTAWRNL